MMRSEESGRGKLTKAFKVSAANGFCGNSLICLLIYFHQPPVYPQLMLQCVTKFFLESVLYFILGASLVYSLPPPPIFGLQSGLFTRPPSSTISPVMSQRDYQLLRFPHSNINISLSSSQFSSSKVLQHEAYQLSSAGREIILLVLGLFARAPASIILFLSCPSDYPCFSSKQNSFPLSPSSIIVSL